MAANVRNSDVAIDASIMIVRVFVRLKGIAHEHLDLKSLGDNTRRGYHAICRLPQSNRRALPVKDSR
jgi:hypothetical protein